MLKFSLYRLPALSNVFTKTSFLAGILIIRLYVSADLTFLQLYEQIQYENLYMKASHPLFILFIALLSIPLLHAQTASQEVWEPQAAGRFYPGNETALKDQINTFLNNIPKQPLQGRPIALISPHAGYQHSGQIAAYGYSTIRGFEFNRVVILAFKHKMFKRFRGVSILTAKNFKTPLGLIPVDIDACNQLLNTPVSSSQNTSNKSIKLFGTFEDTFQEEHSLENQLPFLQMTLGEFKLVPIMVGILMDDDFDKVANTIKPLIDDKTLVVVSSDFTHYGEGYGYVPFKKDIEKNIHTLDYGAFDKILSKDFDGIRNYRKLTGINACGIYPIELLLKLLPDEAQGEILNYDTSGHQLNDFGFSVSYASIIFTKPLETKSGTHTPKEETHNPETDLW